jgi:multimeric flavodoxin WrbA
MRVLGICCSPHRGGNTESLLNEALRGSKGEGAEVDSFYVAGKRIELCDGCHSCAKTGFCHIKDDLQELHTKTLKADALIFSTPTYNFSMPAQTKTIIDRSRAFHQTGNASKLANKVGGIIAVGGSFGLTGIVKDLYLQMITNYMLPGDYVAVNALNKDDYRMRVKGVQATYNLGKRMVHLASLKFSYPVDLMKAFHTFGTWDQ